MAIIGVSVPYETARLLQEIKCPGEKVDSRAFHITLLCLGENVPIKTLSKAMCAAFEVSSKTEPFYVKVGSVSCFKKNDGQLTPIIGAIVSPTLQKIHSALKRSMRTEKVEYIKKYPQYRPHITLSYNDVAIKRTKIEPIEWVVNEIIVWGGDISDRRAFVTLPLSLKNERVECCEEKRVEMDG